MSVNAIKFNMDNRYYDLEFTLPEIPIMFLNGDSSTGKTLFCRDFYLKKQTDKALQNSLVVNSYYDGDLCRDLTENAYNIVIIDNADILITQEIDTCIRKRLLEFTPTRWIIIGRQYFDCMISLQCRGELIQERKGSNRYFSVKYPAMLRWW